MVEDNQNNKYQNLSFCSSSIAITANTFYKDWYPGQVHTFADTDKIRGGLALQFVKNATGAGYPVVISDGSSSLAFKQELDKTSAIILERTLPSRSAGKRQSIRRASTLEGIQGIIKTEPEKVGLIEVLSVITFPIISSEADIVVPRRNQHLFAQSYPSYMYESEIKFNKMYNSILHRSGLLPPTETIDTSFGPFGMRNDPQINSLFMEIYEFKAPQSSLIRRYANPEEHSNAYLFPIVKALSLGYRVKSVEVPFRYPKEQKQNEEAEHKGTIDVFRRKRFNQRMGYLIELIHFVRLLNDNPNIRKKSLLVPTYT